MAASYKGGGAGKNVSSEGGSNGGGSSRGKGYSIMLSMVFIFKTAFVTIGL